MFLENIFGIHRVADDESDDDLESRSGSHSPTGPSRRRGGDEDNAGAAAHITGVIPGRAGSGPVKIEDVCDWKLVSRRYKEMHQIDMEEFDKIKKGGTNSDDVRKFTDSFNLFGKISRKLFWSVGFVVNGSENAVKIEPHYHGTKSNTIQSQFCSKNAQNSEIGVYQEEKGVTKKLVFAFSFFCNFAFFGTRFFENVLIQQSSAVPDFAYEHNSKTGFNYENRPQLSPSNNRQFFKLFMSGAFDKKNANLFTENNSFRKTFLNSSTLKKQTVYINDRAIDKQSSTIYRM